MKIDRQENASIELATEMWLDLVLSVIEHQKYKLPPSKSNFSPVEEFEKRLKIGTFEKLEK